MALLQIIGQNIHLPSIIFICIFGVYSLLILWLVWGWLKIPVREISENENSDFVSILIAARNEEHTLPSLLSDLERQTYPKENFEVILIDDHSEQTISEMPQIKNSKLAKLNVVRLTTGMHGKKMALREGAKNCSGDLLLMTDADCRVSPEWISSFVSFKNRTNTDMIIGLVDQNTSHSIQSHFFRFDFLSLIVAGAGSARLRHPTICNGANLSVNKKLYLENVGNLKIGQPSGDDVFLLHALKRKPEIQIAVLKNKESIVLTQAPATIGGFLNQRLRWASKSTSYDDRETIALGIIVFITNLSVILTIPFAIAGIISWQSSLFILLMKFIADSLLIYAALDFFGKRRQIILLPLFHLVYPIYSSGTALLSLFLSSDWKNRKTK